MFVPVMSRGYGFWGEMPFSPSLARPLHRVITADGHLSRLPETVSARLPCKGAPPLPPLPALSPCDGSHPAQPPGRSGKTPTPFGMEFLPDLSVVPLHWTCVCSSLLACLFNY